MNGRATGSALRVSAGHEFVIGNDLRATRQIDELRPTLADPRRSAAPVVGAVSQGAQCARIQKLAQERVGQAFSGDAAER